ncbi:unnamed protein product, partial [Durusdinium trenchii]
WLGQGKQPFPWRDRISIYRTSIHMVRLLPLFLLLRTAAAFQRARTFTAALQEVELADTSTTVEIVAITDTTTSSPSSDTSIPSNLSAAADDGKNVKEALQNMSGESNSTNITEVVDDVGQTVADIINKSLSGNTTTSSEKVESSATNASASTPSDSVDDVGQTVADIINKSVSGNTTTSSEKVESSATNASASSASDRSTANSSNVSSVADAAEHVGQAVSDIIDKWSAAGNATTSDEKADDIKKTVTDVTEAIKNVSENEVAQDVGRAVSDIFNKWTAGGDTTPSTDEAKSDSEKQSNASMGSNLSDTVDDIADTVSDVKKAITKVSKNEVAQDVGRAVSDIFNKWATGGNETGKAAVASTTPCPCSGNSSNATSVASDVVPAVGRAVSNVVDKWVTAHDRDQGLPIRAPLPDEAAEDSRVESDAGRPWWHLVGPVGCLALAILATLLVIFEFCTGR